MNETWKVIGRGVRTGIVAGVAGTVAMTLSEKIEQALTGRPSSYIPAHTVERLLGLPAKPDDQRTWMNWAAHWGLGVVPAALRGIMAEGGMRGPLSSTMFFVTRMATDETAENVAGTGKPPWSWSAPLATVDVLHKAVYAYVTGAVADALAATPPPLARRTGGHGYATGTAS
jgi:hypothetical protein